MQGQSMREAARDQELKGRLKWSFKRCSGEQSNSLQKWKWTKPLKRPDFLIPSKFALDETESHPKGVISNVFLFP